MTSRVRHFGTAQRNKKQKHTTSNPRDHCVPEVFLFHTFAGGPVWSDRSPHDVEVFCEKWRKLDTGSIRTLPHRLWDTTSGLASLLTFRARLGSSSSRSQLVLKIWRYLWHLGRSVVRTNQSRDPNIEHKKSRNTSYYFVSGNGMALQFEYRTKWSENWTILSGFRTLNYNLS